MSLQSQSKTMQNRLLPHITIHVTVPLVHCLLGGELALKDHPLLEAEQLGLLCKEDMDLHWKCLASQGDQLED